MSTFTESPSAFSHLIGPKRTTLLLTPLTLWVYLQGLLLFRQLSVKFEPSEFETSDTKTEFMPLEEGAWGRF